MAREGTVDAPLRVVLADDSALYREEMARTLRRVGIEVAEAANGEQAVAATCERRPHVVLMDVRMPVMDGLEAIRQVMARCPTPILVLTGIDATEIDAVAMEALARGALEVAPKPTTLPVADAELQVITERLQLLASVSVVRHPRANRKKREELVVEHRSDVRLLAVAASTGGPSALATILAGVPASLPVPLLVAQHLDPEFARSLTAWLDSSTSLRVVLAEDGQRLEPSTAYVIPPERDAEVNESLVISLKAPADPHRLSSPSADRLFRSMATALGRRACGVVLTGMGRDGSQGLLAIRRAGGITFAQDAASSAVDGMPRAARDLRAAQAVLSLDEVASALVRVAESGASWRPPP